MLVNASLSETCQQLDMTREQFRQLQQEDPTLKQVWEVVDKPSLRGTFIIRDDLLYRQWTPPGQGTDAAVEQLVLPQQCRKTVLKLGHSIPLAGHMGRSKTARRILQRFYWPTLFRDVKTYCQNCEDCQKCYNKKPPRAPLIPLPIVEEPFQRVAMDLVGPLPKSRRGNRYILVLSDYATRYPEAIPLKKIDAEVVAEELVKIFAQVGIPKEILTDQGQNFMSQLLKEVYQLLHIQPIRTSPYHPQTDGVVERFNQTLKSMLRKYATEAGRDWDRLIPYVLFAYREVPQSSTGFSPFELLYGRPVRGPLDVLRESWEAHQRSTESVVSYVLHMREKMEKMMDVVQVNMKKAQQQQKCWYDRSSRTREFKVGDEVLVLLPTATNKLFARWQGPYPIVKCMGTVNYQVDMFDRRKRHRTFHVNMLRQWHTPTDTAYAAEETTEEETEDIPTWRGDQRDNQTYQVGEQLDGQQRGDLETLLEQFGDVLQDTPGRTDLTEHSIHLREYAHPVRQSPYRLPHAYREEVRRELDDMVQAGVIEPSTSEWASPIVLVPKKDGSTRLCIDYRRLNAVSYQSAYPMPRVEDLVDQLGKAKFLTTLDLTRGYWQVPLSVESRPRSAFTTPFGLFQFKVMPFGLHGAPSTFQRMMDQLLKGAEHFAAAYLDDVIIFSQSWGDHLQQVREVLRRLRKAGLTARPKKCHFGTSTCVYLGHVVGHGEVRPEQCKVQVVQTFPTPQTKQQVRAFLGLTGYYRKFVPHFSTLAAPLTDLIKKNAPNCVQWTESCEVAFQQLKDHLCSEPVLTSPDFARPFILQTDASDRGVGAVLSQVGGEGDEHPIAYFSRKLLPREEKYSTIEKECLAIKLGIQAFHVYLAGRPFIVQTDHRSLQWMDQNKHMNSRLTRWSLALQPYSFKVDHRPGRANGNADALSRMLDNSAN